MNEPLNRARLLILLPLGIIVFRLADTLQEAFFVFGMPHLPTCPYFPVSAYIEPYALIIAAACALAVVIRLSTRELKWPGIAIVLLWIVALQPFHLSMKNNFRVVGWNDALPPEVRQEVKEAVATAPPVTVLFKLMDGETIRPEPFLMNKHIKRAVAESGPDGMSRCALRLTDEGAEIFERVTSENVGKRIAILLDGDVRAIPKIVRPVKSKIVMLPVSMPHPMAEILAAGIEHYNTADTSGKNRE